LDSIVVLTALSIRNAVMPAFAAFKIRKWKIAICPSAMGFGPPEMTQP
jgi:hypothetical protein